MKPGLILALLTVTAQTSAHTETAAVQDHLGVSVTSKTSNFFFFKHESSNNSTRNQHVPSKQEWKEEEKENASTARLQMLLVRVSYCV